jgi:DNA-binding NarL/FixJ family response regulator
VYQGSTDTDPASADAQTSDPRRLLNLLLLYLLVLQAPESAEAVAALSTREMEVAGLVALGHSNRAIASDLGIAESTVKKHVSRILAKSGCDSRTQLAIRWRA